MPEPQLSVRSARARDLAHRLAREEHRSIARIVERALEKYALDSQSDSRESGAEFLARLQRMAPEDDVDLDAVIREGRVPDRIVDL